MIFDSIKDKKILITGGAGFIGSNIVDHLISNGHTQVTVLDNLETGSLENIQPHIDANSITFIKGDICDLALCLKITEGVDIILHQAALGSVPRSIEKPLDTHNTNVNGFLNVLEGARINKVKRFVYASSSSVYGSDTTLPKQEDKVGMPLSPYAVSKKTNELYASVYASLYNMEIIGLRYFNVFGPKQNPAGPYAAVIPIFINKILKKESCMIYGDGENKRDFTFVENVVQANLLAASTENKTALNQVFNVAFGSTKSVNDLFDLIRTELSSTDKPVYKPSRTGEIKDSFADLTKVKRELNFNPSVSLEDGIKKAITWYKQHYR